jgi:hypothetical protein
MSDPLYWLQMTPAQLNLMLVVINWCWSIILGAFIAFMAFYFWERRNEVRSLWKWLFGRPIPEQFAVAVLIADVGNQIVRLTVAIWREMTGGAEVMQGGFVLFILIGGVIGTFGILCKMRVASYARFGHKPWVTVTIFTAAFCAWRWLI